jgi:septum formation protein
MMQLPYKVILASKSPRRHELLRGLGIPFEVRTKEVDESFPGHLRGEDIVLHLAEKKAAAFRESLAPDELLITADTIVWLGDRVFNKPESREEAIAMLNTLCGRMHEVFTGVSLTAAHRQVTFADCARVYFGKVDEAELAEYVDLHRPFDKAGAYGIQEWIGYAAIEGVEGSFYNVMGLPTRKLYVHLKSFANEYVSG